MAEYGLTDEGYTAPRAADFLVVIRDAYEQASGLTIEWEADTFLGTISAIMAEQLGLLAEAGQGVYDAMDPNNASGLQLDNLAMIVGVSRLAATYSVAVVTCGGVVGTVIRAGSLLEGGGTDGRARWAATEDATIPGGGSIAVIFQAQDSGAVVADAGELSTIVTAINGWTSATNADPATTGAARETDAELRQRRQSSLQTAGSRSLNALRANVLEIEGIQACVVVDNPTMSSATVDGITVAACGVAVVVYPNVLTDAQAAALATAIYENVASGIAISGSVTATVTGGDGVGHPVAWTYAGTQAVVVAISVTLKVGWDLADVEEPAQEAIADYFLALGVGDAARMLSIYALLATIDGVEAATFTLDGGVVDIDPSNTVLLTLSGTATVVEAP